MQKRLTSTSVNSISGCVFDIFYHDRRFKYMRDMWMLPKLFGKSRIKSGGQRGESITLLSALFYLNG